MPGREKFFAYNGDDAFTFALSVGNGQVTRLSQFATQSTGQTYGRLALHPNGLWAYLTGDCASTRNTYMTSVDPVDSHLTGITGPNADTCTGTAGTPDGVAVSADGQTLLIAGSELELSNIVDGGVAIPRASIAFSGNRLFELALAHDERTIVAAANGNKVQVFAADAGFAGVSALQSAAGPMGASDVCVHPTLNVFYAVGSGEAAVVTYTRQTDGTLLENSRTTLGSAGRDVAVSADGRFLWVASPANNSVSTLELDGAGLPTGTPVVSTTVGLGPSAILEWR